MDRYSPKRSLRVPGCEFVLRWSLEGKPPAYLKHHIPLNGAKGDKYFTLYIPALGKKFTLIKWAVYASLQERVLWLGFLGLSLESKYVSA